MSDDAFAWECSKCGTVNGIHRVSCVTCGNGIYKSQAAEQDTPPAERDYAKAAWEFLKATALKPAERPTPITDADNSINSIMARHEANGSPPHMILADVMLRAIGLERQLAEACDELEKSKRGHNSCAAIRDQWKARALQSEKELAEAREEIAKIQHFATINGTAEIESQLAEAREQRDTAMRRANKISAEALVLAEQRDRLAEIVSDLVEIERRDNLTDPDRVATDEHRKRTWDAARAAVKGGPQ